MNSIIFFILFIISAQVHADYIEENLQFDTFGLAFTNYFQEGGNGHTPKVYLNPKILKIGSKVEIASSFGVSYMPAQGSDWVWIIHSDLLIDYVISQRIVLELLIGIDTWIEVESFAEIGLNFVLYTKDPIYIKTDRPLIEQVYFGGSKIFNDYRKTHNMYFGIRSSF